MLVHEMQTKTFLQAVFFLLSVKKFFQEMALIGREVGKSTCLAVYGRSGGGCPQKMLSALRSHWVTLH